MNKYEFVEEYEMRDEEGKLQPFATLSERLPPIMEYRIANVNRAKEQARVTGFNLFKRSGTMTYEEVAL